MITVSDVPFIVPTNLCHITMPTTQTYRFSVRVRDEQGEGSYDLTPVASKVIKGMRFNERTGRVTEVRFPAPFDDLVILDGEIVHGTKAARLREATRVLIGA